MHQVYVVALGEEKKMVAFLYFALFIITVQTLENVETFSLTIHLFLIACIFLCS